MRILLKLYSKNDISQQNSQLKDLLPRVIYLCRILFEHNNSLSPQKIDLLDFYPEDPNYQKLARFPISFPKLCFEFVTPTILVEPYK